MLLPVLSLVPLLKKKNVIFVQLKYNSDLEAFPLNGVKRIEGTSLKNLVLHDLKNYILELLLSTVVIFFSLTNCDFLVQIVTQHFHLKRTGLVTMYTMSTDVRMWYIYLFIRSYIQIYEEKREHLLFSSS